MFTSGQSDMGIIIFSALTFSVAVPSAVKVYNWLATLYKGSISMATPMLYGLVIHFPIRDWWFDRFATGNLGNRHPSSRYVLCGCSLSLRDGRWNFDLHSLGGLFHWWPKMFGRMYNDFHGRIGAIVVFFGFNLTFFPQFIMGSRGMPRRYATYDPDFPDVPRSIDNWCVCARRRIGLVCLGSLLITEEW